MKNGLTVIAMSLLLAVVLAMIMSAPVEGDCSSGIKAVHLDKTAKAFVDDTTIEIDDTNGLQVKALPDGSVKTAKVETIFGSWTDKDSDNNTLVKDTVYKATSDGFVLLHHSACCSKVTIKTDNSNPPTMVTAKAGRPYADDNCVMSPIKRNDYWKCEETGGAGTTTIRWMPIGSGQCEKQ